MAAERAVSGGRRTGERLGARYRLVQVLGQGGMGEVYEAEDTALGRRVAIKCLWPELARDEEQVQRFEREARAASAVASAHVADVIETGVLADGAPYIVMELLVGETLSTALAAVRAFPVARAASIARQIASGLSAAHGAGVVHRDLKPENVFLLPRAGGRELVKILDFGVSKFRALDALDGLTRTGTAIGTPAYMSPEQSGGARDVDHRTDVWALGVILHRMLAGELPFTAENYARLLLRIVSDATPQVREKRPDVPPGLEAIIVRCLAKAPQDRYASMAEVAAALTPYERSTARLELTAEPAPASDGPTRVGGVSDALVRAAKGSAGPDAPARRPDALAPTAIAAGAPRPGAPAAPPQGAAGPAGAPGSMAAVAPPVAPTTPAGLGTGAPPPASGPGASPSGPGAGAPSAPGFGGPQSPPGSGLGASTPPRVSGAPSMPWSLGQSTPQARRERGDASRPFSRAELERAQRDAPAARTDLPAPGPGFRAPRESYAFDVEEVLRLVRPGASVKGLFLSTVLERAPDRAAIFARAGVAPMRVVAFLDVDYDVYLRVLVAAAEVAHPGLPRTLALRRFHHPFYETFADTLAGRVMFGVLGRDPEKVMPVGAQGYKVNVKLGDVRSYSIGPKHVRYEFRDYPKLVCECCDVGVIEGALRFLGEGRGRVLVREDGADAMTVDLAW